MSQRPCHIGSRTRALAGFAGLLIVIVAMSGFMPTRPVTSSELPRAQTPFADPEPSSGNPDVPRSWAEQAERSIARQEYQATRNDRGLQAPNREHNLRTYFEPWGARIEDRTADGRPELLRMRTVGLGREGQPGGHL